MAAPSVAARSVLLSALAAITVPPPGLAVLQARLADGQGLPPEGIPLADLGLDSLGRMEFCIQLELDHGVPLTPDRLAAMDDLGALLAFIASSSALPAAPPTP